MFESTVIRFDGNACIIIIVIFVVVVIILYFKDHASKIREG